MEPSIITLLTDFGSQDYFVAAMKGVILWINPRAQLVDLTHEIPPQNIESAAFNLLACYRNFPANTIHLAVVDPGVGSKRLALALECAGQFFVGPDNGLFSWICEREGKYRAFAITNQIFFRKPASTTFHGRDIFAPVAAALSYGTAIEEVGEPVNEIVQLSPLSQPKSSDSVVEGRIIHIDHFGNCVTNLSLEDLPDPHFEQGSLRINGREISQVRSAFADADEGRPFCYIGSAGFLEIGIKNGSARDLLRIAQGDLVVLNCR